MIPVTPVFILAGLRSVILYCYVLDRQLFLRPRDVRTCTYVSTYISCLFLFYINQIWIFSEDFSESFQQDISRTSNQWESSWSMWTCGWTDIHEDGNGSFWHLFHESARIRENFKDMSRQTDICERTASH